MMRKCWLSSPNKPADELVQLNVAMFVPCSPMCCLMTKRHFLWDSRMTGTHWNRLLMMLRRLCCASKWMSYDATNTTTTHFHVFKEVYVCESYSMRKYLNLPMEKNVHIRCINTINFHRVDQSIDYNTIFLGSRRIL